MSNSRINPLFVKDPYLNAINTHVAKNLLTLPKLFKVDVDKSELWETYQRLLTEAGMNPIYRTQPTMNCNTCRNFFRLISNVIGIRQDGEVVTPWSLPLEDIPGEYREIIKHLNGIVSNAKILTIFLVRDAEEYRISGQAINISNTEPNVTWEHLACEIPQAHVGNSAKRGEYETNIAVFTRYSNEILPESLEDLAELIQNGLYRGNEKSNFY